MLHQLQACSCRTLMAEEKSLNKTEINEPSLGLRNKKAAGGLRADQGTGHMLSFHYSPISFESHHPQL